jgi:transposase
MNSSFLYHAFGLYSHECTRIEYKGNTIILNVQSKERQKVCPKCGKRHLVKNGYRYRDFIGLPIGGKKVIIRMKVQRYRCKSEGCDYDQQEDITFATGSRSYTHRFAKYVVDLLKVMTIKGVENIGIDEFAVKKGHIYKTIVVDLNKGRIIYVGEGKGTDALDKFWKKVSKKGIVIKTVATDLSSAFTSSVLQNVPGAVHVFDHFHVVKLMNDKLDDIRRSQYAMEKDINKRNVIKGTKYLILQNGKDVLDKYHKNRLENVLAMNAPLNKAYYLKESLREIWTQINKEEAEKVLLDWVQQAQDSGVKQLKVMANTIMAHRTGILAWYDNHISTAKVEGINNKIKVMKRTAYGFRDDKYFKLRLFALHDCRITRNVG